MALHVWEPGPAAIACAAAIVERMRRGWFPVGMAAPYADPWRQWFGGSYEETIDPAWRKQHMEAPA